MNIAFDIDGVFTNYEEYQLEVAKHYFKKKYNRDIVNDAGYDLMEIYGVGKKEFHDFWAKHIFTYAVRELAKSGASECLKKLASDGDTIYIITARILADQDNALGAIMRKAVRYWLKKEGLDYEKLVFVTDDKVDAIKKYQIQVMVEDSPKNIKDLSEYIEVICMNAKYNQGISNPHIHRVNNFEEVYEVIKSLKEKIKKDLTDPITPRSGKMSIDRPYRRFYDERQANLFLTNESIYEYIYNNNIDNMSSLAIDYFDYKMTFKEFFRRVDDCAKALKANGVKRKEIVSICMPNTPEAVIMLYAINKIGAVANMIHPLSSEEEIKHYLNETNSRYVLAIDASVSKLQNIIRATNIKKVIVASPGNYMPLGKRQGYKVLAFMKKHKLVELADQMSNRLVKALHLERKNFTLVPGSIRKQMKSVSVPYFDDTFISWQTFMISGKDYEGETYAKFDENELAFILHTGGSTGDSKGVMLSNENVNANTIQLKYSMPPYKKGDKILAVTPIFHGFGLVDCIHNAFAVNMSVILLPQFELESYTKALLKHPFMVIGVPSLLDATIHLKELQHIDQPYDLFISGGAPLYKEKEEEANEYARLHNGQYAISKGGGMTETTAAFTFTMDGANKLESVGIPLPLNTIKIVNPDTLEEVAPYEQGEICIKGPTVMLGYYNDPIETNEALRRHRDGNIWLHTGDIGYFDNDGVLYYSDRIKRMLISNGYNVYPQQIEKAIMLHPDVLETVAIGVSDDKKGQVAKAFVVLKPGVNADKVKEEIFALCEKHLARYSLPKAIEVVDMLPKTLYNKPDFRRVEEEEKAKTKKLEMGS